MYSSGHHGRFNLAVITNKEGMEILEGVTRHKPSALVGNIPLDLQNFSYHTQPRPKIANYTGCLPFVRIYRLERAVNNGKGFFKISKPTERNGAYHLQFDFP